jgi:hypothetical protein
MYDTHSKHLVKRLDTAFDLDQNRILSRLKSHSVSFMSLPLAVTLPYTYKSVSFTLPPPVTVDSNSSEKPQYVVSSSGYGSHPEDIIASCEALQGHVLKVQEDAQKAIKKWEDSVRKAELAGKRKVTPGWLDMG